MIDINHRSLTCSTFTALTGVVNVDVDFGVVKVGAQMEVINRNAVAAFVAPDGGIIRELAASRNSSARKQSLAEATIPVGGTVIEHFHKTTEEFYYILERNGTHEDRG